jgi:hypothetical protein
MNENTITTSSDVFICCSNEPSDVEQYIVSLERYKRYKKELRKKKREERAAFYKKIGFTDNTYLVKKRRSK